MKIENSMNEELYAHIFKRKSTRKFIMEPLEEGILCEIDEYIKTVLPLYYEIKIEYKIADAVKGLLSVKAPHYIIISSEKKPGYLENAGFVFQHVDLFLSRKGLGSCWLGMAKPAQKTEGHLDYVIAIAFGKPIESPFRDMEQFKRKSLNEISKGFDERLICAQLAPSATNSQHWFFVCEEGRIHCYLKKLNVLQLKMYENMNRIDIGIAIAHLCIATNHFQKDFSFFIDTKATLLNGYTYIGTVN